MADGLLGQDFLGSGDRAATVTSGPDDGIWNGSAHSPGLGVVLVFGGLLILGRDGFQMAAGAGGWVTGAACWPVTLFQSHQTVSKSFLAFASRSNGNAFRTALLVQYPRAGSWTIAFGTGSHGEVAESLGNDFVSVRYRLLANQRLLSDAAVAMLIGLKIDCGRGADPAFDWVLAYCRCRYRTLLKF